MDMDKMGVYKVGMYQICIRMYPSMRMHPCTRTCSSSATSFWVYASSGAATPTPQMTARGKANGELPNAKAKLQPTQVDFFASTKKEISVDVIIKKVVSYCAVDGDTSKSQGNPFSVEAFEEALMEDMKQLEEEIVRDDASAHTQRSGGSGSVLKYDVMSAARVAKRYMREVWDGRRTALEEDEPFREYLKQEGPHSCRCVRITTARAPSAHSHAHSLASAPASPCHGERSITHSPFSVAPASSPPASAPAGGGRRWADDALGSPPGCSKCRRTPGGPRSSWALPHTVCSGGPSL